MVILLVSGCGNNNQSTVSVYGTGTVLVKPDMIRMNISLSKTAPTTKSAQEEVNRMVRQALNVLADFNIEDKSINTASLTFSPEYEYRNNRPVLVGQKARQTITFSIDDLQNDGGKISQIIDRLVQINGIELNQLTFNVKDNTGYFVKSRELAFRKAAEKAQQYAALSGLKAAKVLSVSEEGSQQVPPISNRLTLHLQYYSLYDRHLCYVDLYDSSYCKLMDDPSASRWGLSLLSRCKQREIIPKVIQSEQVKIR